MSGTSPEPGGGRPFTIRTGTPADAEAIWRVHRRSILELGREFYSQAEVESWAHGLVADRYARNMSEGDETFFVAVDSANAVIGFCSFHEDEIRGLYVDPSAARSGIGGALLRRAEAEILTAGQSRAWLQASRSGQPFYKSRGYEAVAEHPWKSRGGLEIMVQRMEKTLC